MTMTIASDATTERTWLDERSWVDVTRGWLAEGTTELYDALTSQLAWRQSSNFRYDRYVDEPRVGTMWSVGRGAPGADASTNATLLEIHKAVRRQLGKRFDEGFAIAWYRDGRDSVAFHRDRDMRWLDDTVIALLSLGQRRPWLLRPRANRYAHELADQGAIVDLDPGPGDLLVMGGATQAGWEHAVPKVDARLGGRVSLQWRWTSGRGKPVVGASYRAPRTYSR
jgi:alkylated DNA repair dioxygenase AlkB